MSAWTSSRSEAGCSPDWQATLTLHLSTAADWSAPLKPVVEKLATGEPLNVQDGLLLYNHADLNEIGSLAHLVRSARFENMAFFNSNVHVNQTNVCVLACKFCAFRRSKNAKDAYALDIEAYIEDLGQYAEHVDEVHSVGGLHPEWGVEH